MSYNANQLFNFIQGSDISGESAYDIWKRLGNVGTEAEFLEFIRSGPKGEKGDAAHIYGLAVSSSVIKKDANSVLVPSSITFSGYYRVGNDITRNEYAGKFVIQETTDGGAWVTKYESNVNEPYIAYTPSSSNVNFIKCTLYSSIAEDAIELDVQSVAILTDGVAGEGGEGSGESPLVAILSNEAHVIATDSEGNGGSFVDCNTTIQVFKGTSDVTSEATYEVSEFDGITGSWDLSTYSYTVTGLSVDVSHVDITATYDGVSITKRFAVSKSKSGLSAYEIWLSLGNKGTEEDFLNSLKGPEGAITELPSNIAYFGDDNGEVVIPSETPLYTNSIVDNLESTSSNMALSANQGRVLNEKIEDIIANSENNVSNEEVIDIRKDVDGVTHDSAGDAVRSQINKLSEEISSIDKDKIGLGNVDNTSDLDKPVSTATQSAINQVQTNLDELAKNVVFTEDEDNDIVTDTEYNLTTNNIVDNLNTDSDTMVLSARQGKVLNDKIDSIIDGGNGSISEQIAAAKSEAISDSKGYTDEQIADLINGAPTTLDTLKEIADAMTENKDVVDALDEAIGKKADASTVTALTETVNKKANQSDLEAHINDNIIHITEDEHNKLTDIKTEHIVETTSDEMPDSYEGKLLIEEIAGSSEQNTYNGNNLIPLPHDITYPYTNYGVTFNYDKETGYITANGTAASTIANYSVLNLQNRQDTTRPFYLPKGKYRITGCPNGGSGSTYRINIGYSKTDGTYGGYVVDYGNGAEFEVTDETRPTQVQLVIQNGYSVSNMVFKPMICKLEEVVDIPYPYLETSKVSSGITWTDNGDGTVTANGTNELDGQNIFSCRTRSETANPLILKAGTYKVTGCPSDGSTSKYYIQVGRTVNNTYSGFGVDIGSGVTFTITEDTQIQIQLVIAKKYAISNIVFKPELRQLFEVDDTFEPYVGEIASPNPDYPQEIKKTIINSITTYNKNLITIGERTGNVRCALNNKTDSSVTFTRNVDNTQGISYFMRVFERDFEYGTYTASCKMNASGRISIVSHLSNQTFTTVATSGYSNKETSVTFVVDDKVLNDTNFEFFVRFDMQSLNNGDSITFYDIQLEKNDTKTDFVEPESTTITLSEPIELRSFGAVRDEIINENGTLKVLRRRGKHRFTSNESGTFGYTGTEGQRRFALKTSSNDWLSESDGTGEVCTHALLNQTNVGNHGYFYISTTYCVFTDNDSYWADLDAFKAWLDANEVYIEYNLKTPVVEEIATADQIALNSLSTYNEITYLKFDSEIEPTFKAKYGVTSTGSLIIQALTQSNSSALNYENVDIDFETEY